jgi:cell division protein FtsL
MDLKLLTLTVLLFAIFATLLVYRQQRLQLAHELMVLRKQAEQNRQVIWTHEAAVAEQLTPDNIARLSHAQRIVLEPATPLWHTVQDPGWRYAAAEDDSEVSP